MDQKTGQSGTVFLGKANSLATRNPKQKQFISKAPQINEKSHLIRHPSNKKLRPVVISITEPSQDERLISYLDNRLRDLEEQKMFEREEKRIKQQLRKKQQQDLQKSNEKIKSNEAQIEGWKNLESNRSIRPQVKNESEENAKDSRRGSEAKLQKTKRKSRNVHSNYFIEKPRFQITNRDMNKEEQALDRILRREQYIRQHKSESREKKNILEPLDPENLIKWRIEQDKLANPSKYLRLQNMSTREIFFTKDAETREHLNLIQKGNSYLQESKKRIKKNVDIIAKITQPTLKKHRYINYLPQIRTELSVKSLNTKPSKQDFLEKAKNLEIQTVKKVQMYVQKRNAGLRYTERGQYQDQIDKSLIQYIRAKVKCIDTIDI